MTKVAAKLSRALTEQQQLFAIYYVETGNASEAYRRAYPTSQKWTPNAVHVKASRLLAHPGVTAKVDGKGGLRWAKAEAQERAKVAGNVAPLVDQLREAHAKRHEITIDDLIAEFDELRLLAIKNNQTSAAVAATAEKRRLLFGDKCKVELAGPGGGAVQVEATAAIAALIEAMPELLSGKVIDGESAVLASVVPAGEEGGEQ